MMNVLEQAEQFIRSGDSVPLAWVVAHGGEFEHEWARSEDSRLMISIAAAVISRTALVLTACAVVRTTLKYFPSDKRPLHAIQAAERWAHGKATAEEAHAAAKAAYPVSSAAWYAAKLAGVDDNFIGTMADNAVYYTADDVATLAYSRPILTGANSDRTRQLSYRKSARIIRKHIPMITVADLVRAGKNGWKPPS